MPCFAELNSGNVVVRVVEAESQSWCEQQLGGTWVQTFPDTPPNVYAGDGFTYLGTNFQPPSPFPSWVFDAGTWQWQPPVPLPAGNGSYVWAESSQQWLQV